jgi:hypothetical protein
LPNTARTPLVERRLRGAGVLIAVGLIIQLTTFIWTHPSSGQPITAKPMKAWSRPVFSSSCIHLSPTNRRKMEIQASNSHLATVIECAMKVPG